MVKDLLSGDRSKGAGDDAKIIVFLSGRAVILHVEIGRAKREKILEETKIMYG